MLENGQTARVARESALMVAGRVATRRATKAIYKNVLAKAQKECKEKPAQSIEKNGKIDVAKAGQYTVEEWCWLWHENYCKPAVKDSTAEYYRSYIEHHIAPNIGKIKLEKLITLDLQNSTMKLSTLI